MSPRTGRPTDDPKRERITVSLDGDSVQTLMDYCAQERIDRAEGIRRGIKKLKADIKK